MGGNIDTSTNVIYDEVNLVEYSLPADWIIDNDGPVFNGITLEESNEPSLVFNGITLEESNEPSLVFNGITLEIADKKPMDPLFFAQN